MASRSWNRVELIGNLTRDPELRFTSAGTAVATFGLATNRTYVSEGEKREEVDFHRVVAWGKLGELCNQLLKKGSRVFISGRLQYREWETQEGQKKRDAEIVLEDMILLTPKNGSFGGEEISEEIVNETFAGAPRETLKETPASPEVGEPKEEAETKDEAVGQNPNPKPSEEVDEKDLPF